MSTQKAKKIARRTIYSLLAEIYLCKKLGWDIGFLSGGHKAYETADFLKLLKNINKLTGRKIWINIGALKKEELIKFKPYIKGIVGSIETVNKKLHDEICPSKPIKPFVEMFSNAKKLKLKKAMTIILGLGETINDFPLLKKFIEDNEIEKIHFYSLNPQKGTAYENVKVINPEYQAEWIARTRIEFPKIDIQAGIWVNRVNTISLLLKAGANSISKFPAIKLFGTKHAREIEKQAAKAGRKFKGTLTKFPRINLKEIDELPFQPEFNKEIKIKLNKYVKKMKKNERRLNTFNI